MADGDAASAVGIAILTGVAKVREFFKHINATRDLIANHITGSLGRHSFDEIDGTLVDAQLPASIDGDRIAGPIVSSGGTSFFDAINIGGVGTSINSAGAANLPGGIQAAASYAQSVAGHGGFRTLNVAADGLFGGLTSSRRFKEDIADARIPREVLRALRVVVYRYIAQTEAHEPLQLGLIAEEVEEAGLRWLVDHDEDGLPYSLVNQAMPFLPLLLAQDAQDRLDAQAEEIAALRAAIADLKGNPDA